MSFPWSKPAEKEPEIKTLAPEEDPPIASELTPEEQSNQRSSAIRAKLKEDLRHKTQPGNHFLGNHWAEAKVARACRSLRHVRQ